MLQHLLDEAKYYPKNLKGREHAPLNRSTEDSFIQFQLRPKVKYSQIPEKVPGFEFKTIHSCSIFTLGRGPVPCINESSVLLFSGRDELEYRVSFRKPNRSNNCLESNLHLRPPLYNGH